MPHFKPLLGAAGLALLLLAPQARSADPADPAQAAVDRALPFVRAGAASWIEERKCVTCHHVAFGVWALREAAGRRFDVDAAEADGWRTWSRESFLAARDDGVTEGAANLEGVSQVLWAERSATAPSEPDAADAALFGLLVAGQRADGSWPAMGQLPRQKRPPAETDAASTMWHALALGTARGAAYESARAKAVAWLDARPAGVSTEFYAARLLLAAQSAAPAGDAAGDAARELRSFQRADGGWGWLTADESDALGTGLAVYALRHAGAAADDPAVRRAVGYLVSTQSADGSWTVRGTKETAKDRPAATATYWGTCWAALALMTGGADGR